MHARIMSDILPVLDRLTSFETCRCLVSGTARRAAIKTILKEMDKVSPAVKTNISKSLTNNKTE